MQPVVESLYRNLYSKMVASLISYFGLKNFSIAEDIVQDTFVTAIEKWPLDGLPDNPQAWLFRVCKNKTLNLLEKRGTKVSGQAIDVSSGTVDYQLEHLFLDHEIHDNQLRLLFACCHPVLSPRQQLILILKNLCGLKVEEIAKALLMSSDAVTKMLSRSKKTLAEEQVRLQVPFLLRSHQRLNIVHTAIYLMFNEGYSATGGDVVIRKDLCIESMRLIKSILEIKSVRNHDTFALFALMCFHTARFEARIGTAGEIIELELQDRLLWDRDLISVGIQYLRQAHDTNKVTRFILEAAIASVHSIAEKFELTNWPLIVGLYDRLATLQSTPFVDLNRAVAIYYAAGPEDALKALSQSNHLTWLKNYYLYYAVLGKIYTALKRNAEATKAYEKALSLTTLRAEQDFLRTKLLTIQIYLN